MTEKQMCPIVSDWICSQGYVPLYELLYPGHYVDIIGVRFALRIGRPIPQLIGIIVVEMKIAKVGDVLSQLRYSLANYVYAAMPDEAVLRMKPATVKRFRATNIGLLRVGANCDVAIPCDWRYLTEEQLAVPRVHFWRAMIRQAKRNGIPF